MTTFNGFLRSTNAALNRMERAHNQRVRRAAQIEKIRQKQEMLANARPGNGILLHLSKRRRFTERPSLNGSQ